VDSLLGVPTSLHDGASVRSGVDDHAAYGGLKRAESLRNLLLPVLQAVQSSVGWVSHGAINYISQRLDMAPAEAYGVATFYDLIATEYRPPVVAHVCDDIACLASGTGAVFEHLESEFGPAGVVSDGATWLRSPCLGQCEKGSAMYVQVAGGDDASVAPVTGGQAIQILGLARPVTAAERQPAPQSSNQEGNLSLLSRVGATNGVTIDSYLKDGGYDALTRALDMGAAAVVAEVVASGIQGRGGAAFPAGIKWEAVARNAGRKFVVCNADESEPGTFKDRVLLEHDPFTIIEAMTIAGYAVGAEHGYIYLRGEYPVAHRVLTSAVDEAGRMGFLGARVNGTEFSFNVEIRRGAGAYICGEETSLFNSIEGYRGEPRQKPPFPTDEGLFGRPTLINNVETLANIPSIVLNGGDAFASIGTDDSKGPKLFCLSGNVATPGVYEVPFGATVRDLIDLADGPTTDIGAVLIGGAAGSFISPDDLDMPLTFEATRERGIGLGSGVIVVFDSTIDMAKILQRIAEFFGDESCGLCIPCRVGTVRQGEALERLASPTGDRVLELEILDQLDGALRDGSVCGLGQAASVAVQSAIALGLIGAER
jgi:NADH-quinone oxidoreductase subunit F